MGTSRRLKRVDIYKQIVGVLKGESCTILQVSKKTSINWETVRNAIEILEKIRVISKEKKNNKNYYFVDESKLIDFNQNTLLGLPITKEREKKTCALAKKILEIWNKFIRDRPLNKTFLNKILVKVVRDEKIENVPYGWYLFGMCAVLKLEPQTLAEKKFDIGNQYDKKIGVIVKEYSHIKNTKDLLQKHYSEEGNELYLNRLKISNLLMNVFDESSINLLKIGLRNFLFSFIGKDDNQNIIGYLNGFVSVAVRLIKSLSLSELEDIRPEINDTFISIWELVGTYNLYESVSKFYDKQTIKKYYLIRVENLKHVVENYISSLQDYLPIKEQKEDSLSRFKGILAS